MTVSQMIIESNVDVTDNLTAPLCEFGDELCNLKVVKNRGEEQLLITLPTNGKAYDKGITSPPPVMVRLTQSFIYQ